MSSALPPALSELTERLGSELDGNDRARAELALDDPTALALADVTDRIAAIWTVSAPAVVRLVVIHAARREYENPEASIRRPTASTP